MGRPINFEKRVIRERISSRGGGVEIALDTLGYKGGKMTAYQNYLGGGMLGAVSSICNIRDWEQDPKLVKISEGLKKYFHGLTNPEDDEWAGSSYEDNQKRSVSAY
jgi:hypothetical protein